MDIKDVEILNTETVYKGYGKIQQYKIKHKLFAGGWSNSFLRELYVRPDAVAVLPYDPKLDQVVLIEQFRVGALRDEVSPWQLELVAGVMDKDKTEAEVAVLEVQEEAGLETQELIPIYKYWSSPGGTSEHITMFCAIVDSTKADGVHGLDDENEDILVHVMSSKEAFAAVKDGKIKNAFTIIGLQWLDSIKGELNCADPVMSKDI